MGNKAASSKKTRKRGRDKVHCESYKRESRRERNKAIRLIRHIECLPNDACAKKALEKCYAAVAQSVIMGIVAKRKTHLREGRLTA